METKQFDSEIQGKDGKVKTTFIQRHKPTCSMKIISLASGHFLFCQSNHPVIINSLLDEYNTTEVEAELVVPGDKIWVDNSVMFQDEELIPSKTPSDVFNCLFRTNEIDASDILLGNDKNSYRFKPEFVKYSKAWVKYFVDILIKDMSLDNLRSIQNNIVLLQQIKLLCDRVNVNFILKFDNYSSSINIKSFIINKTTILAEISDYVEVVNTTDISDYDGYVYDVKTSTEEFLLSGVQTHNSFHSGGASSIAKINLVNEIMNNLDESYRSTINTIFKQVDQDLVLNTDRMELIVNKNIYTDKYEIQKTEEHYILPLGYFNIKVGDMDIIVTIEQETLLRISKDVMEDDEKIIMHYHKDDIVLKVNPKQIHPEKIAASLDELIGGKSPFNTPEELFIKIYKTLNLVGLNFDTVHLEVAISNILRSKKDPQRTARTVEPYEFQTFSIKTLPGVISYPLGIAFESFSKAVNTGLIADRAPASPIEKIFFGEPLSDLAQEQLKDMKKKGK